MSKEIFAKIKKLSENRGKAGTIEFEKDEKKYNFPIYFDKEIGLNQSECKNIKEIKEDKDVETPTKNIETDSEKIWADLVAGIRHFKLFKFGEKIENFSPQPKIFSPREYDPDMNIKIFGVIFPEDNKGLFACNQINQNKNIIKYKNSISFPLSGIFTETNDEKKIYQNSLENSVKEFFSIKKKALIYLLGTEKKYEIFWGKNSKKMGIIHHTLMDLMNKFKLLKKINDSAYLTASFFEYFDGELIDLLNEKKDLKKNLSIVKIDGESDIKGGNNIIIKEYLDLGDAIKKGNLVRAKDPNNEKKYARDAFLKIDLKYNRINKVDTLASFFIIDSIDNFSAFNEEKNIKIKEIFYSGESKINVTLMNQFDPNEKMEEENKKMMIICKDFFKKMEIEKENYYNNNDEEENESADEGGVEGFQLNEGDYEE